MLIVCPKIMNWWLFLTLIYSLYNNQKTWVMSSITILNIFNLNSSINKINIDLLTCIINQHKTFITYIVHYRTLKLLNNVKKYNLFDHLETLDINHINPFIYSLHKYNSNRIRTCIETIWWVIVGPLGFKNTMFFYFQFYQDESCQYDMFGAIQATDGFFKSEKFVQDAVVTPCFISNG